MKKIILLLLTLTIATSCLRSEDHHSQRTAYGAVIVYEGTMSTIILSETILQAVEVDIITQADLEDRNRLIAEFFPYCELTATGDIYSIIDGHQNVVIELSTDGQTLTTPGAKWNVTQCRANRDNKKQISVSCLTPNSWKLESTQIHQGSPVAFNSELTSSRTNLITSPRDKTFELICDKSTLVEPERSMLHCLTTIDPLVLNFVPNNAYTRLTVPYSNYEAFDNPFVIAKGRVTDQFIHPATGKTDVAEASVFSREIAASTTEAKITYCGFTEDWNWRSIPSYQVRITWF